MSEIFLRILNISLIAGWMILAVLLLRVFLKKAPRWILCLLWALVAIRLMLPFTIESVTSLIPSSEVIPTDIADNPTPVIDSGIRIVNETVNPIVTETFAPAIGDSANPLQIIVPIAAVIWLAGITGMLGYAFISFLLLKRRIRASVPFSNRRKTTLKGVWVCDEIRSPFILGIFKPNIYIPSSLDEETEKYVIAHEMAHLKRRDHWWKPFGFLLLSVYWFHPLCWLAYILLCRDIESACDEKVIKDKNREYMALYSQALLDCALQRKRISACPLAFGETDVKGRIKGILNYKKPAFWIVIAALVCVAVVTVCFLTNPKRKDNNLTSEVTSESQSVPVNAGSVGDGVEIIGDIDNNGIQDRIIYGEQEEKESYTFLWNLEFNGEIIYHGENVLPCHFGDVWYLDLDEDGKEEIFINVYPAVNSMPQTQYVALKKDGLKWVELENTDVGYDSDNYTNAFPITVLKGKGKNIFEISCKGLADVIEYDITDYYTEIYNSEEGELKSVAKDILYSEKYSSPGATVGSPAAWGVWEIARGTFGGKDCIIATHGIQGMGGKFDILGTLDVYFNYDKSGKLQVLYIDFKPSGSNQENAMKRLLMINGVLYQDTGYVSGVFGRCGNMDGNITKVTDASETPDEDGEANFEAEGFQLGSEGTIEVPINGEFCIFAPKDSSIIKQNLIPENVLQFMATVKEVTDDGYVIVEVSSDPSDRFATRVEKGKTYKLSLDCYNPGIYVNTPVAGNMVVIACKPNIEGENPGLISDVYTFSPVGSSPKQPVGEISVNVSDWLSAITLPEGYSFGEYIADGGYGGCFRILPRVYNVDETSLDWQFSGMLTKVSSSYEHIKITYSKGIPNLSGVPIHNHTVAEYISIIGLERSNMQWPAIMLKESHDLYTQPEIEHMKTDGVDVESMDLTSDYWYFWFVKEGADKYYVLSLSADRFSKEEAIEIAKSVSIKE